MAKPKINLSDFDEMLNFEQEAQILATTTVGTGGAGQSQRSDPEGGRRSGAAEGTVDTAGASVRA